MNRSLLTFVLRHPLSVLIELQNWSNILMKIISLSNIALYRHGQLFIYDNSIGAWCRYVLQVNGVEAYDVTGHRSHVTDLMRQSTRRASDYVVFNRYNIRRWFYCNQFLIFCSTTTDFDIAHKAIPSFMTLFQNKNTKFPVQAKFLVHTSNKKNKTWNRQVGICFSGAISYFVTSCFFEHTPQLKIVNIGPRTGPSSTLPNRKKSNLAPLNAGERSSARLSSSLVILFFFEDDLIA